MLEDEALFARWQAGDNDAGKELLARYFRPLYRFFANKCTEPEELSQATFLALVAARQQFAGRSSFRTYVYTVARHTLYRHLEGQRRGERFDPLRSSLAELATSAASRLAKGRERELLLVALRTLPVEQQTMLELHYWEGLGANELGEVFEVPGAAIRKRLHRARAALRRALIKDAGRQLASDDELDRWARGLSES